MHWDLLFSEQTRYFDLCYVGLRKKILYRCSDTLRRVCGHTNGIVSPNISLAHCIRNEIGLVECPQELQWTLFYRPSCQPLIRILGCLLVKE